jgi:hypothetical protein
MNKIDISSISGIIRFMMTFMLVRTVDFEQAINLGATK